MYRPRNFVVNSPLSWLLYVRNFPVAEGAFNALLRSGYCDHTSPNCEIGGILAALSVGGGEFKWVKFGGPNSFCAVSQLFRCTDK